MPNDKKNRPKLPDGQMYADELPGYKTSGGVGYISPTGFDDSVFKAQLAAEQNISKGLDAQAQAAKGVPGELSKAQADSILSLRANAARALGASRGLAGGGRGMGLARDVAARTGLAEGNLRAGYTSRIADAKSAAAQALTSTSIEKAKLVEAQAQRRGAQALAVADANGMVESAKGAFFFTKSDRTKLARALLAKRNAQTNPEAWQVYDQKYKYIVGGGDISGNIDF